MFGLSKGRWELTIKQTAGRLTLARPAAVDRGPGRLPPATDHARPYRGHRPAPAPHRDPSARMLVAQAVEDGLTLVTADQEVQRYLVAWLW